MNIQIDINKKDIYAEVSKNTAYIGAKLQGDERPEAYERISTTEANAEMLDRFWYEAETAAINLVKPFVSELEDSNPDAFRVLLVMPSSFDANLSGGLHKSLFGFFSASITAKWLLMTDKPDAADYAALAGTMLEDAKQKLYHRRKPVRVIPTTVKP